MSDEILISTLREIFTPRTEREELYTVVQIDERITYCLNCNINSSKIKKLNYQELHQK